VDGLILWGWGLVDMQNFTSNPTPLFCSEGHQVYASSVLLEGELCVLVKRIGANTRAGLAASLAQLEPVHDTKIGAQQAELVKSMVMPTLTWGGAIYLMTGNVGAAISPYQLDFCSGIPISISTTLIEALSYAARNGVFIRSGRVLELLAQIDAIVVDMNAIAMDDLETVAAIATLRRQNIDIYLITSTTQQRTLDLAWRLGIDPDYTYAQPDLVQKINLVCGLQHQGKTIAFVGREEDEIVRLACADVSIVFDKSGNVFETTANVVILEDDLRGVIYAIAIARRAMEVVQQNAATILAPNLFMQIGGGIILGLNPILNVIVNNSTAFISEFLNNSRPLFERDFLPPLKSSYPQSVQEKLKEYSSLDSKALILGEQEKPSELTTTIKAENI
jgi:cation transport ATPase